jgi:5-methyltetrahydropteroyltriglutamate--homocysteine methyltransferase
MSLQTTCLGAYPKPDYLPFRDWFTRREGMTAAGGDVTREYTEMMARNDEAELETLFARATREAVEDQVSAGIDIPSDGEQRRENYIHYHCRHLEGFDFDNLTSRILRDGAYETELPTISGKVVPRGEHFLPDDFRCAQGFTDRPVKMTVPGPLTIMDTTANTYYGERRTQAFDLAQALNYEIRALADAGCQYIQVDEPLFARKVDDALDFGVEALERCFDGVPDNVTRVMHMCCGYPNCVDDENYHKADRESYFRLAAAVDASSVHQISIEDAHRHNDLSLFEKFARSSVVFGVVAIAKSRVETVDEIAARVGDVLGHIDRERLILAPDCGLGLMKRELVLEKLRNLCAAARQV